MTTIYTMFSEWDEKATYVATPRAVIVIDDEDQDTEVAYPAARNSRIKHADFPPTFFAPGASEGTPQPSIDEALRLLVKASR